MSEARLTIRERTGLAVAYLIVHFLTQTSLPFFGRSIRAWNAQPPLILRRHPVPCLSARPDLNFLAAACAVIG